MIKIDRNRCLITSRKYKSICIMYGDFIWKGTYLDYFAEVVEEGSFKIGTHSKEEQLEVKYAAKRSGIEVEDLLSWDPSRKETLWVDSDDSFNSISGYTLEVFLRFPDSPEVFEDFIRRLREDCGFKFLYRFVGQWKAVI